MYIASNDEGKHNLFADKNYRTIGRHHGCFLLYAQISRLEVAKYSIEIQGERARK
jgi:hypothetical protein